MKFYYINLDRCEDRNRDMKRFFDTKLKTKNYKRIAGLDGKKIFDSKLEDTFFEFPDSGINKGKSVGAYGCTYSHLKALQAFVTDKSNQEDIAIICEDDIDIFDNIEPSIIYQYLNKLPKNWEIFKIQQTSPFIGRPPPAPAIFRWKEGYWGTCAYIIKRSAAQRFVDTFFINNRFIIPPKTGIIADRFLYNNTTTYGCFPGMFYQKNVKSTIHEKNSKEDVYSKKWYTKGVKMQKKIWENYFIKLRHNSIRSRFKFLSS